jgi:hypothetical protein
MIPQNSANAQLGRLKLLRLELAREVRIAEELNAAGKRIQLFFAEVTGRLDALEQHTTRFRVPVERTAAAPPSKVRPSEPAAPVASGPVRRLLETYNACLETARPNIFNARYSPQSMSIIAGPRPTDEPPRVFLEQSNSGLFLLVEVDGRLLLLPILEIPDTSYLAEVRDCFEIEHRPGVRSDRVVLTIERPAECVRTLVDTWGVVTKGQLTLTS